MHWAWTVGGVVAFVAVIAAIRRYSTMDASPTMTRDQGAPEVAPNPAATYRQPVRRGPVAPAHRSKLGILPLLLLGIGFGVLRVVASDSSTDVTVDPIVIDIPTFDNQAIDDALNESGIQFDLQITLADAVVAAEGYWFDHGTYEGLDERGLKRNGFKSEDGITVTQVVATKTTYCIEAQGGDGSFGSVDKKHVIVRPRHC